MIEMFKLPNSKKEKIIQNFKVYKINSLTIVIMNTRDPNRRTKV